MGDIVMKFYGRESLSPAAAAALVRLTLVN